MEIEGEGKEMTKEGGIETKRRKEKQIKVWPLPHKTQLQKYLSMKDLDPFSHFIRLRRVVDRQTNRLTDRLTD